MRSWAFAAFVCGACASDPPETLFVDHACSPDGIAADETHVYWTALCGSGAAINATSIIDGTTATLVPNEPHAYALRMDDESIYWEVVTSLDVHAIDGEIRSIPKAGGSPTVLASAQAHPEGEPGSFLVDDANVYWSNAGDSTVMMVPKVGGTAPTVLAQASYAPLIAVDTSYVYWSDGPAVHRIDKQTGQSDVVYTPSNGVHQLAARGSSVYIWSRSGADNVVYSLHVSADDFATPPTQLLTGRHDVAVPPFLVDDAHLYWLESEHVMRSDLDGNVEDWIPVGVDRDITDLASNSTDLYWSDNSSSRIYTAPK